VPRRESCIEAGDSLTTEVVEAYGARLVLSAPDHELMGHILDRLPPGWRRCGEDVSLGAVAWQFELQREGDAYRIRAADGLERRVGDLDLAIQMLRTQMRRYVGHYAPDLVFVHAGVVAHMGQAILLPGESFSGKSTLVDALVRAGADFYSDEFAVLDGRGRALQYREPLIMRVPGGTEELDIAPAMEQPPIAIGMVAIATYTPGSTWLPARLSVGAGVLAMLEHAVPARQRPADTIAALSQALEQSVILRGERGEADETARALLDLAEASWG
jgi:hypothetical protein